MSNLLLNYPKGMFRSRRQSLLVDNLSPVSSFSPDDLPNLVLWLDASDTAYRTVTGSSVDAWADKNGSGISFVGAGAARPTVSASALNGNDVFVFDGVDDVLSSGSTTLAKNVSGCTLYIVRKRSTAPAAAEATFFISNGLSTGSTRLALYEGITPNKLTPGSRRLDSDSVVTTTGASNIGTLWQVVSYVADFDGGTREVFLDGVSDGSTSGLATGSTSNTDSLGSAIGANAAPAFFADVSVAYILIYHAAHGSSERNQVTGFLNLRFGL